MRWVYSLLLVFLVSPAFAAPFLVGTWYGEGQPNSRDDMWVARMGANGDFEAEFRSCLKGNAINQVQTGHWSLHGDIETIVRATVDDAPFVQTDIYKILSHDARSQTYRYLLTGWVYKSVRVADDFQLPSCVPVG